MLDDDASYQLARVPGRVPRAAWLCYALAFLFLVVSTFVGYFATSFDIFHHSTVRSTTAGVLVGIFGGGLWVALGTHLSLLAQIADRDRGRALPLAPPGPLLDSRPFADRGVELERAPLR